MLLAAMGIGALVGGLAGLVTYGAKTLITKEPFHWKDALAATAGGVVGGGLFPVALAGLAATGLPVAASYIVAGGVAWGGLWTVAQDLTSWALGRRKGLGSIKEYAIATAIGVGITAVLTPAAVRIIQPGMRMGVRQLTVESMLSSGRSPVANVVKAEAEFLAYGALNEAAGAGLRGIGRMTLRETVIRGGREGAIGAGRRAAGELNAAGSAAAGAAANSGDRSGATPTETPPAETHRREVHSPGLGEALEELGGDRSGTDETPAEGQRD